MSRPVTIKPRLPKSIGMSRGGKFRVIFTAKEVSNSNRRTIYVGTYDTLEEAVKERDAFIIANYNGVAKGYMPRGVSFVKRQNSYQANLSIEGTTFYIGTFKTIPEAIEARNKYIESLK